MGKITTIATAGILLAGIAAAHGTETITLGPQFILLDSNSCTVFNPITQKTSPIMAAQWQIGTAQISDIRSFPQGVSFRMGNGFVFNCPGKTLADFGLAP